MAPTRQIAAAALVLLVLCGSAAAQAPALALPGTSVVIGCIAPISTRPGPSAAIRNGVRMAVADAKTPGVTFVVDCQDSKGTPAGAAAAMEALVAKKAVGVVGDFTSGATAGALEVADKSKVPLVSPSASSPTLTKANDYFFRTVPSDLKQAVAAADMMAAAKAKHVVVLDDTSLYGVNLKKTVTDALTKLKIKVTPVTMATAAGSKAAVAAVEKAGADAVFFSMNDIAGAAAFIKDAASMKLMLFAGDSIMSTDVYTALGANAAMLAGSMRGTGFTLGSSAWRTRFTTFANSPDPPPVAAHAYDAATLLIRAYTAAAAPKNGAAVAAAIPTTRFAGVVGPIALDNTGDLVPTKSTYVVYKFGAGGKLEPAA